MRTRLRSLSVAMTLFAAAACGGYHHHLADYEFAGHSMAVVSIAQPAPSLLTGTVDLGSGENITETVMQAGSKVAKDREARRARARLDSAIAKFDLTGTLASRTLGRTSRYLGVHPAASESAADYLMEIHMHNFGIDARKSSAAYLYTNAEAVLLDRRTGREIWHVNVHGTDRLTPRVNGPAIVPDAVITASGLHYLTVADFRSALDDLMTLSSNVIADELRAAMRDVKRK
jgi:hypothetical protein